MHWTVLYFQYFSSCVFLSADSHLHSLNLLYPRTLKCWNNTGMMIQKAAVEEKPGWMVSSGKSGTVHVHSSKHMFRFLDGGPSIHHIYVSVSAGRGRPSIKKNMLSRDQTFRAGRELN